LQKAADLQAAKFDVEAAAWQFSLANIPAATRDPRTSQALALNQRAAAQLALARAQAGLVPAGKFPAPPPTPGTLFTLGAATSDIKVTYNLRRSLGEFDVVNGHIESGNPAPNLANPPTPNPPARIVVFLTFKHVQGTFTIPRWTRIRLNRNGN